MGSIIPCHYGTLEPLHKFGQNPEIDTGTVPEDVWSGGGAYPWPAAAATTTIVSDSTDDDVGGTGATEVTVIGLDSNYLLVTQTVAMDGTTPVTLDTDLLRVFRAYNTGVGSGDVNAGNITVKHGATTILKIDAGLGQTTMAIYTVPDDYDRAYLTKIWCQIMKTQTTVVDLSLWMRPFGEGWRIQETVTLRSASSTTWQYEYPVALPTLPKTDLRWRVTVVSANDTNVLAGFDMALIK